MTPLRLPSLIDPHVHLREPGQTHKEDWDSGTAAALAGGFTQVLAMPNTNPPLVDVESWQMSEHAAQRKARCDYGIYVGGTTTNPRSAPTLAGQAAGLKLYLNDTFGTLQVYDLESLMAHMQHWPASAPLVVHAEGRTVAAAIFVAELADRAVHICHVSRRDEIALIAAAKARGMAVTCEVCPHHLFLSLEDAPRIGPGLAEVRPMLTTPADVAGLWEHWEVIDCIATDHAPHLISEKLGAIPAEFGGRPAVPGYAGLETALALMLQAVHEGKVTLDAVIERMTTQPRRIFGLTEPEDSWIMVDPDLTWTVRGTELFSRCGWTPFEGKTLRGRVTEVVLRGQTAYAHGEILAAPGTGRNVRQQPTS